MLKLFCFPRSGNSREVRLALEEKQIPYEAVDVHADEKVKESEEFKKASPGGKVPAIVDGSTYMSEAYDINEYLEKSYPDKPLLPPDDETRDQIRKWVALYDKRLCLKIGLLLIETILKPKDQQKEETKDRLKKEIAEALSEIEKQLAGKEYLFGGYSLADISVTPHIAALPRLQVEIGEDLPNVKAWFGRIQSRPNFSASN